MSGGEREMGSTSDRRPVVYSLHAEAPLLVQAKAVERTVAGFPCVVCKESGHRSAFHLLVLGGVHFPIHEDCQVSCALCKKPMSDPLFAQVLLLDLPREEMTVWVPRHDDCPIFVPRHAESLTHEPEAIHVRHYR